MDMADVLRLTGRTTVARIMERDDFSQRFRDGVPIALSELLYPLLQGTDSVEVRADVELGGTDQLFNNLMGRQLQSARGDGAAGRDHHAAARGPRRREEDVEVARQLRGDQRAGRPSSSASS